MSELEPKYGRYNKKNIIESGNEHKIKKESEIDFNYHWNKTKIEEKLGVKLSLEQVHELCDYFIYMRRARGYIPYFNADKIQKMYIEGKLKTKLEQ